MNKKVLLLALYKKKPRESFKEVVVILENSHLFTRKEGKRLLRELKKENLINETELTVKGLVMAKGIEEEFKL